MNMERTLKVTQHFIETFHDHEAQQFSLAEFRKRKICTKQLQEVFAFVK